MQLRSFASIAQPIHGARTHRVLAAPPRPAAASDNALDALISVGMEPDAAAQVLLAAGAGGAAPAGAAVALVCRVLTDVARVPVARLREILPQAPELLAAAPEELLARYAALGEAWPAERQLQQAVATYPGVLARDFPANLQRCMATLSELGFSNAQVAAAILRAPSLATLRWEARAGRRRRACARVVVSPAAA
jgi:hypothetical protein